jgi:hypothetical protein
MKREFERIMRPTSTSIGWRMTGDAADGETFHEIVVVRFKGSCQADGIKANPVNSHYLAITHEQDGEILPFSRIDCRQLLGMLSLRPSGGAGNTFEVLRLLGRAMGRVLAHEVFHAILKTPNHSARGIAKPSFTPAELFGAELRFEPLQVDQLNAALSQAVLMPGRLMSIARLQPRP